MDTRRRYWIIVCPFVCLSVALTTADAVPSRNTDGITYGYDGLSYELTGHVCVSQRHVVVPVNISESKPCTKLVETTCGWLNRRCTKTVLTLCWTTRLENQTRNVTLTTCCDGWAIDDHGACNTPICSENCLDRGACVHDEGVSKCHCREGFYGDTCQYICPVSCQNNSTCSVRRAHIGCICQPGFTGPLCELHDPDYSTTPPNAISPTSSVANDTGGRILPSLPVSTSGGRDWLWAILGVLAAIIVLVAVLVPLIHWRLKKRKLSMDDRLQLDGDRGENIYQAEVDDIQPYGISEGLEMANPYAVSELDQPHPYHEIGYTDQAAAEEDIYARVRESRMVLDENPYDEAHTPPSPKHEDQLVYLEPIQVGHFGEQDTVPNPASPDAGSVQFSSGDTVQFSRTDSGYDSTIQEKHKELNEINQCLHKELEESNQYMEVDDGSSKANNLFQPIPAAALPVYDDVPGLVAVNSTGAATYATVADVSRTCSTPSSLDGLYACVNKCANNVSAANGVPNVGSRHSFEKVRGAQDDDTKAESTYDKCNEDEDDHVYSVPFSTVKTSRLSTLDRLDNEDTPGALTEDKKSGQAQLKLKMPSTARGSQGSVLRRQPSTPSVGVDMTLSPSTPMSPRYSVHPMFHGGSIDEEEGDETAGNEEKEPSSTDHENHYVLETPAQQEQPLEAGRPSRSLRQPYENTNILDLDAPPETPTPLGDEQRISSSASTDSPMTSVEDIRCDEADAYSLSHSMGDVTKPTRKEDTINDLYSLSPTKDLRSPLPVPNEYVGPLSIKRSPSAHPGPFVAPAVPHLYENNEGLKTRPDENVYEEYDNHDPIYESLA